MLTLNDGRSELWQWDTGRTLIVSADCSQVHFSNKVFGRSIDVDVVDGVAEIPDFLLQTDKDLTAWAFVGTAENGYTKISKVFKVNKRNKPADYVFTPTDQTTLDEILDRIEDLENRPSGDVSKENIQNAVNDYFEKNPISVEEKDPTVPEWAKQPSKPKYTADEVGALPDTVAIPVVPSALPNPHKLTINGAVKAEYDGSSAVTVTIPESSSGGDYIPIPTTAEIGQTIVVKAVDENGKPTEWEMADMRGGAPTAADWKKIATVSFIQNDETVQHIITQDENGNGFSYDEIYITSTSTDGGGELIVWLNSVSQFAGECARVSNFFGFGSAPFLLIERLHGSHFLLRTNLKNLSRFVISNGSPAYEKKIHTIVLSRAITTNLATIDIFGRSYG